MTAAARIDQRKRPVQRRSAATVACILEAAAHILEAGGLEALTTNAVAIRAGVSIGSLYQYFPNKDALTAALILQSHERIVAALAAVVADTEGAPLDTALDALFDMLMALQAGSPRVAMILEAEEERLPRTAGVLDAERRIDLLNRQFFGRYLAAPGEDALLATVAADVIAIVRAMLDTATRMGKQDGVRARMLRTVKGYLAPLV